jgi:uncharacterized protein
MLRFILSICLIVTLSACTLSSYVALEMPSGDLVKAKVSATSSELARGLSGVNKMQGYDAMLFKFSKDTQVSFWMKDMRFPLDIIYLNKEKVVQEFFLNVPPCEVDKECLALQSNKSNIFYVVEVPAGMAEQYKLEKGSLINW